MNEPNLPGKYNSGDSNYGRVTKGAAYALRGQVYMWQKNWEAAVDDFNSVADCGFGLYTKAGATSYKQLLKIANEQCEEMIFSVQCIKQYGYPIQGTSLTATVVQQVLCGITICLIRIL